MNAVADKKFSDVRYGDGARGYYASSVLYCNQS